MITDHTPRILNTFRGLFDRGDPESIPLDHLSVARNLEYDRGLFKTRRRFTRFFDTNLVQTNLLSNVERYYKFSREGLVNRYIVLKNNRLYDTFDMHEILNIAGMTDFSMTVINNRAYISPHDGTRGLAGQFVYVYNGAGMARAAAGLAPVTNPNGDFSAATLNAAGRIEQGTRLFAVAYETDSGFVTKPGPEVFARYNSEVNGQTVRLTNIPVVTNKRHLLATKRILDYDGNQDVQRFYYIPNGTLDTNVEQADLSFFDSELIDSADELFDALETIPAGLTIGSYGNRMVVGGENNFGYVTRISDPGKPELIDAVEGLIEVDKNQNGRVQSTVEFRNQLYIHKSGGPYATYDNGDEPAFWPRPELIDPSVNTGPHGICQVLDKNGNLMDKYLTLSDRGILIFDGKYEYELTYKIETLWKTLSDTNFHKNQLILDSKNQILYALTYFPDKPRVLSGNYKDGFDLENIKWSLWDIESDDFAISSIGLVGSNQKPIFAMALTSDTYEGDLVKLDDEDTALDLVGFDNGNVQQESDLISKGGTTFLYLETMNTMHIGGFRVRLKGKGDIGFVLENFDYEERLSTAFSATDKYKNITAEFPEFGESVRLCIDNDSSRSDVPAQQSRFEVNKIIIYTKEGWEKGA